MHPSIRVDGPTGTLETGRGAKVSERCVITVSDDTTGSTAALHLGPSVWIGPDCTFEAGTISIGAHTTVQRRSSFAGTVAIGSRCILAPNVFMSSGIHTFDRWPALPIAEQEARMSRDGEAAIDRPIVVGDDCWIGINVVVSPGCTIGNGAIVGANAVVTADVEPYAIVAGTPARPIGSRLEWKPLPQIDATSTDAIPYLVSGFEFSFEPTFRATLAGPALVALDVGGGRSGSTVTVHSDRTGRVEIDGTRHELVVGSNTLTQPRRDTTGDHYSLEIRLLAPGADVALLGAGWS